ncbi:MAG: hypothetical protein KAX44_00890 [Candidatus Brocadiae bacterium]|nr:hypothetical protein [Candidatus Brocadiia bacterium]
MSSLPKNVGLLGGVVAFCAAMLVGLLYSCPPLLAMKKAAICGVVVALVARLSTHLAMGVVRDGLRRSRREKTG